MAFLIDFRKSKIKIVETKTHLLFIVAFAKVAENNTQTEN
jgi:hypothetical protein